VDDVLENVEGARKIGMQGVRFLNPKQAMEELHNLMNGKDRS
jgi:FMN phosphatase YigB (HAD superfamily)